MPINEKDSKSGQGRDKKTKGPLLGGILNKFSRKVDPDMQDVQQEGNGEVNLEQATAPVVFNFGLGEPNAIVPVDEAWATFAATEHAKSLETQTSIAPDNNKPGSPGKKIEVHPRPARWSREPERRWRFETPAKLTIFLLENSSETRDPECWDCIKNEVIAKHLEMPNSNVVNNSYFSNSAPEVGYVCFIRYEDTVSSGSLIRVDNKFDLDNIILMPGLQPDTLKLYEAIQRLRSVVNHSLTRENLYYRGILEKIKKIEIIGIGSGIDSGSVNSRSRALKTLSEILERKNVSNKYYCLSEDDFPRVAALGFRNIVSMTDRELEIFDSD